MSEVTAAQGGRSNGRGGRRGRGGRGRVGGRGRNNNHNGRGEAAGRGNGLTMPVEDLERKVNSGLMSARAPPKVTAAAARDRSATNAAIGSKNPSLPKKDENEENNGKVSRGGGCGALVGTTNEDGVAGRSSSKPEAVVAVQATVERSAQGKNSLRANFNWSDEVDDHNNDISGGGGGNGNGNRKKGSTSKNGRGSRGERAGSGSNSNAGCYVIAPTVEAAVNTNNTNTPTTVVVPNPLSNPSIVRSPQPPIDVNVDYAGDAVPQNIHTRARNRRSNSSATAVVPNPLSSDADPPTTIIPTTTTTTKKTKKKIRPKLTPSMDDLTTSVEDDDYALWTAPSPLPPSPPPSSTKNESDNHMPLSTPSSTSDDPMRFSSASLGPSPAKLKKGITNELFMNGGEDSIMSMNSSMDDGTTLSVASSSKASAAKQKTRKKKKKTKATASSSSPQQPSLSATITTTNKNTKSHKHKVNEMSIDTTITTTSSNDSTSPIAMIISSCLSENSIAIRQKATQLLLRQPSDRRSSSISTSTEDRNEKSKTFLTHISSENEVISPTLMEKKVLVDVSDPQEKEDVKEEEEVVVWPPQDKTNKDDCCSMCVLS